MTIPEVIAVLAAFGGAAVAAGAALARVRALEARVKALEGGAVRQGARIGKIGEALAVIEYKLFGRRPTTPPEETPDRT